MKKWFITAGLMLTAFSLATAQGGKATAQKIGFINVKTVYDSLPVKDSAEKALKALNDYLTMELDNMNKEYEQAAAELDAYNKSGKVDPTIKEFKEGNLQRLSQNIYTFQQKAQENLSQRQTELYTPIINDIKASSQIVAKQGGYTQVLDVSNGMLLYSGNTADDLTNAVIKYMRSQPAKLQTQPKPAMTPGTTPGTPHK